ncbi:hypothetical protein [Pseudonocardia sp.]|uniref:hypothetical protein n=1 Tax=Pseudonocardia sp. TaxID=60912 RepID=UPI003D0ECA19
MGSHWPPRATLPILELLRRERRILPARREVRMGLAAGVLLVGGATVAGVVLVGRDTAPSTGPSAGTSSGSSAGPSAGPSAPQPLPAEPGSPTAVPAPPDEALPAPPQVFRPPAASPAPARGDAAASGRGSGGGAARAPGAAEGADPRRGDGADEGGNGRDLGDDDGDDRGCGACSDDGDSWDGWALDGLDLPDASASTRVASRVAPRADDVELLGSGPVALPAVSHRGARPAGRVTDADGSGRHTRPDEDWSGDTAGRWVDDDLDGESIGTGRHTRGHRDDSDDPDDRDGHDRHDDTGDCDDRRTPGDGGRHSRDTADRGGHDHDRGDTEYRSVGRRG